MRSIILLLIFAIQSTHLMSHEDTYRSFQLSNIHLKVSVGFDDSYTLKIAEAYAHLINDFIVEQDSNQFVFLQFDESYCSSKDGGSLTFLSIDSFKTTVIPAEFPYSYDYDMGFINNQYGLNISLSTVNFRIEKTLGLIEFGLNNTNFILEKQEELGPISPYKNPQTGEYFEWGLRKGFKTLDSALIDSVIQSSNQLVKRFIKKELELDLEDSSLNQFDFKLVNDSIRIKDAEGNTLITIPSLQELEFHPLTNGLFVFDSDTSFYFIDVKNQRLKKRGILGFSIKYICENWPKIEYYPTLGKYTIRKGGFGYIKEEEKEFVYEFLNK